ncbi:MAG: hypothetical protein A2W18_08545 [Candidatus Muproteobacteria bacterium RBG_16_60_9]|uniref:Uncharacterized protein n=1 Tax=Candidatus Muproteobacteria bacterium RBG_16_60_9 TaxID=1817755 RepID=A0A1F6VGV7_9PROT|nr:MAG: hypothetical protein A2W18_08545 [Candidatus Muproteobacteria bacterium RBG_16_60_9]
MDANDLTQRMFVEIWMRLTFDWNRVTTFHLMGTAGSGPAEEIMRRQNAYFAHEVLPKSQVLKDPAGFVRDGLPDLFSDGMTKSMVATHREVLDAAALVIAHSILDATLLECLRLCALADPSDLVSRLKDRKISFSQAVSTSLSKLLAHAINDELKAFERQSMLFKIDRLFEYCRPTRVDFFTDGFRFDHTRMKTLDEKRHLIVHVPGDRQHFDSINSDLEFMNKSGLYMFLMIADRYHLRMTGDTFLAALKNRLGLAKEVDFLLALSEKIDSVETARSD